MQPHYFINIQLFIIIGPISRLHRNEVGRLSHPVHNDPNGIMQFPGTAQTNHKFNINSLAHRCWDLNRLGKTSRHKVFGLNMLVIGQLLHKHRNISLHTFPPIEFFEIYILVEHGWMEYLEPWASPIILGLRWSILRTHNLPRYLSTPSPQGVIDSTYSTPSLTTAWVLCRDGT